MTPVEFARQARQKLERGWTQGVMARDACGERVAPCDPEARCWCLEGALKYVLDMNTTEYVAYREVCGKLRRTVRWTELFLWNDAPGRKKEEVLSALDDVIHGLEAEVTANPELNEKE